MVDDAVVGSLRRADVLVSKAFRRWIGKSISSSISTVDAHDSMRGMSDQLIFKSSFKGFGKAFSFVVFDKDDARRICEMVSKDKACADPLGKRELSILGETANLLVGIYANSMAGSRGKVHYSPMRRLTASKARASLAKAGGDHSSILMSINPSSTKVYIRVLLVFPQGR